VAERDRIAELKEVAELMPDDPVVRFGLAGAYLEAGQAESAVIEGGGPTRRPGRAWLAFSTGGMRRFA
jgi:hypothetical protein